MRLYLKDTNFASTQISYNRNRICQGIPVTLSATWYLMYHQKQIRLVFFFLGQSQLNRITKEAFKGRLWQEHTHLQMVHSFAAAHNQPNQSFFISSYICDKFSTPFQHNNNFYLTRAEAAAHTRRAFAARSCLTKVK